MIRIYEAHLGIHESSYAQKILFTIRHKWSDKFLSLSFNHVNIVFPLKFSVLFSSSVQINKPKTSVSEKLVNLKNKGIFIVKTRIIRNRKCLSTILFKYNYRCKFWGNSAFMRKNVQQFLIKFRGEQIHFIEISINNIPP